MHTQLALVSLRLSHFRSHKSFDFETDGGPVAIFGANGAGKTNILEAISMLSPGRGLRRAKGEHLARKPEALGWKVAAILENLDRTYEIETMSENGGSRQVRIDGKAAPQIGLGQIARMLWLVPSMDRLWIEGAEGRRRFLDRMAFSFFPSHGDTVLTYEKAMRERNRLLKDGQRDAGWYAALEMQMARTGTKILRNRQAAIARIGAAQEKAKTAFPSANLLLVQSEGTPDVSDNENLLKSAFENSRPRDLMAGRTLVGPHRADLFAEYAEKNMPAQECSTGEQKALLVSLMLANCRALKAEIGVSPILLLDEIAAHLDTDRRAALYDEICALGAQAWMTGTEKDLFESLGSRATYLEIS